MRFIITPWSRVLQENITVSQLAKKLPAFYVTRRFITAFTRTGHLSLFGAGSILSTPSYPTCWRTVLILSSHLRLGLPCGLFPSGFPSKYLYALLISPIRAAWPVHLILLDLNTLIIFSEQYRSLSSSLCSFMVCRWYIGIFRPVAYRGGVWGVQTPPKFRRYRWSPRSHEQEELASRFSFVVHCVLIRL